MPKKAFPLSERDWEPEKLAFLKLAWNNMQAVRHRSDLTKPPDAMCMLFNDHETNLEEVAIIGNLRAELLGPAGKPSLNFARAEICMNLPRDTKIFEVLPFKGRFFIGDAELEGFKRCKRKNGKPIYDEKNFMSRRAILFWKHFCYASLTGRIPEDLRSLHHSSRSELSTCASPAPDAPPPFPGARGEAEDNQDLPANDQQMEDAGSSGPPSLVFTDSSQYSVGWVEVRGPRAILKWDDVKRSPLETGFKFVEWDWFLRDEYRFDAPLDPPSPDGSRGSASMSISSGSLPPS